MGSALVTDKNQQAYHRRTSFSWNYRGAFCRGIDQSLPTVAGIFYEHPKKVGFPTFACTTGYTLVYASATRRRYYASQVTVPDANR